MIRLQTQMLINQPAINVYFDDISLTRPIILPVNLVSFTGREADDAIELDWAINPEMPVKQFELEQSTDAIHFKKIATLAAGKSNYHFTDDNNDHAATRYFYRLKMTGADGEISYSHVVMVKAAAHAFISLSPNPAKNKVTVKGSVHKGILSVINSNGQTVRTTNTSNTPVTLDVSRLPAGLYVVRYSDAGMVINRKLVIEGE
jgi:hypothetical protein